MSLRPGVILKGARATYKLQQALKGDTVFKAQILDNSHSDSKWHVTTHYSTSCEPLHIDDLAYRAVIKTSTTESQRLVLHREFTNYQIPEIRQSPYIRRLHEAVGAFFHREFQRDEPLEEIDRQHYLVFEWMDQDLWQTPSAPFRSGDHPFPRIVSRSVLEALEIFRKVGKAHTDINPNNILVSGLEGNNPEVKVADLGMLLSEGRKGYIFQCAPCRAPEVFRGEGVFHSSDIWSLGVTLTHWLRQEPLFGASDKIVEGHEESWCIAKIMLMVGPMGEYNGYPEIEDQWDIAEQLKDMDAPPELASGKLMKYKPLREELARTIDPPISSSIIDFIESLLIIDPSKRPTAEEALRHPFLSSLMTK
ncbi:kinase-like domain-containing protein [Xylaria bambusicola]|uniref:kinase-like domain-containing protein n=1 Tax=Xylaria bambusicola TaxID=326684 RepID=UPI002007A68F|nr:kinase-like domain-containing protein [Xylaria bambusicola]KAI0508850.1 kinase-like domain-containing protein [Xylaria bambusicola]